MEIVIRFGILEVDNKYLFINEFKAFKVEGFKKTLIKEKIEKDFLSEEDFKLKVEDIKNMFLNKNIKVFSNIENSIIQDNFENVIIEENIKFDSMLLEMKEELKDMEIIRDIPSYINLVPETEFKRNSILFLSALYFEKSPCDIFDFPLFLKLKEEGQIEESVEVEGYIENLIEDIRSLT